MLVKSRCFGSKRCIACNKLGYHLEQERSIIGKAFEAASYAATGFYRDRPTEEEYKALEAYEEKYGIHAVVQTYFHAWCDAGRPDACRK